jgi:hypothetical protein
MLGHGCEIGECIAFWLEDVTEKIIKKLKRKNVSIVYRSLGYRGLFSLKLETRGFA